MWLHMNPMSLDDTTPRCYLDSFAPSCCRNQPEQLNIPSIPFIFQKDEYLKGV